MTRELAIIIGLVFLVVCVTSSDYAGLSFKLTRSADDKFKNPTATGCDWQPENQKFCIDTNSQCLGNCCQCACNYDKSTFDRSTMKCRNNDALRSGCTVKFDGKYVGAQIKFLDLSSKGKTKIYWFTDFASDKVKSFNVISIAYHDGSAIKTKILKEKGKPKEKWSRNWEATIEWNKVSNEYYGKLFRVNISYEIERKIGNQKYIDKNDCFVFKSSGSITVTFPSLPSTTLPPSTTKKSTSTTRSPRSTSPTTTPPTTIPPTTTPPTTTSPTATPPTAIPPTTTPPTTTRPTATPPTAIPPTTIPPTTINGISTPTHSMITTQIKESKETRKPTESNGKTDEPSELTPGARKEGGGGGNDAMTVSLAVVGCLLLLVAVVVVVLWTRRRSAKASKEKNRGAGDADGSVDNPLENIYAEADTSINYPQKDKNNHVYEYAKGNLESNYTSLDMSKVESKPTYESLVNVQSNMYEQIPVKGYTPGASGVSGQTPIAEPFYHVVDTPEGGQDPGQIYHDPDNCETRREIPGRTGDDNPERVYSTLEEEGAPENYGREVPGRTGVDNPERVYSTLEEEETAPENYGREVPGRTGDDDPDRVYSVLEDETAESDYLTILPEKSDYEQPINPPMSDA